MDDGRRERLAELVHRYGRMVFATTYRILGRADEAEDALQEVFLKLTGVWDGQLEAAKIHDWGAYLRVMATRAALNALRARSRRQFASRRLRENTAAPASRDSAAPTNAERMHCLREALAQLSERDAAVFTLRYLEEVSYEQVARELNLSISQVGVILHRTRKRLRRMVDETFGDSTSGHETTDVERFDQC